MKIPKKNNSSFVSKLLGGLIHTANIVGQSTRRRAGILNGVILIFLAIGIIYDIRLRIDGKIEQEISISLIMLIVLGFTYYLNRILGKYYYATIMALGSLTIATFASAFLSHRAGNNDYSILYYLIIVILMGDFFLSFREFILLNTVILGGLFFFSILYPPNQDNFLFIVFFCGIIIFFSSHRRSIGKSEIALAGDIRQRESMLLDERRRTAHLSLLEEVGRRVADSFDQMEILQRSINAVINQFGYAEAAISLLTKDNKLEVAAIGGTEDFGYSPGFQQELGTGIIGHTAEIRKTYISNNVSEDPYYFSNDKHYGSAISIPIVNEGNLFGVLYVESSAPTEFGAHDIQTLETLANQISSSIQRAILYNQAQESLKFMSAVQAVTKAVTSSLDLKIIFETVVSGLKLLFGYSHISIYILNGEYLELGAQVGYPEDAAIHKIHISQGVSGRAVKTKLAQFIRDASQEPSFLRADPTVSSEICIPLIKDDKVLGMFNVEGDANHLLTDNDLNLLSTLAGPIALALDNARLHAQVKEMALTDAVTGLSSRHAFEHTLTTEVERAKRLDLQLSLIIFDLDSFKEYNDTWGHPAGDVRLKATADLIRANLRKYDLAARFGGDEFAIIMPNTDKNGALELAKRLQSAARASTKDTPIEGKGVSGYTISLGLATFPEDGNTFETLLFGADQAELTAKRTGKNRIVLAGERSKYVED